MKTTLILLALLLVGMVMSPVLAAPLVKPGDKIVTFGDSISSGQSYGYYAVQLLNAEHPEWKLQWADQGHPGWTSKGAATVIDKVLAEKPSVVTIMFGTNDLGLDGSRGIAEFKARMRALVEPLKQAGVRVILLTTPYAPEGNTLLREEDAHCFPRMGDDVIALAQEEGVPVFDMFTAMREIEARERKTDPTFSLFGSPVDGHPSPKGHQAMGRALADFLAGKAQQPSPRVPLREKKPRADALHVAQPIDIAAVPSAWPANATPMLLDNKEQVVQPAVWRGPQDLSARGVAAWDAENLYLRIEVTDPIVVTGPKQPAWGYDSIEFFFDTRPLKQRDVAFAPGYFQLMVPVMSEDGPSVPACGAADTFDPATVKTYSRRTPTGYVLTVAMPWRTLRFTPHAGANIGLDFTVINKNEPKDRDYFALWRGAGSNYLNAGSLGVLRLK